MRRFIARVPIHKSEYGFWFQFPAGIGADEELNIEFEEGDEVSPHGYKLIYAVSDDSPASASEG